MTIHTFYRAMVIFTLVLLWVAYTFSGYTVRKVEIKGPPESVIVKDERCLDSEDELQRMKERLALESKTQSDDRLVRDKVFFMMQLVKYKNSELLRYAIADAIVRVSRKVFLDNISLRLDFVVLIAMESAFKIRAKSPIGAVGLTQIRPKFAHEFLGRCGFEEKVDKLDLYQMDLNLLAGACQLKHLMLKFDNNVAAALVAYNAGAHSKHVKRLRELRNIQNEEAANYSTRYLYLRESHKKVN